MAWQNRNAVEESIDDFARVWKTTKKHNKGVTQIIHLKGKNENRIGVLGTLVKKARKELRLYKIAIDAALKKETNKKKRKLLEAYKEDYNQFMIDFKKWYTDAGLVINLKTNSFAYANKETFAPAL